MASFKEIKPTELNENPFKLIGEEWALLGAKNGDKSNAMTISWGSMGVMWNKNVAFAFVRPQRYTLEFIDNSDMFTLSFFGKEMRNELSYCGSVSGRNEDKLKTCGFTEYDCDGAPCFEEARLTLVCRKLYRQELSSDCFIDKILDGRCYPQEDYHVMFAGEIVKVIVKE